jgi:hypothetical protein
VLLWGRFEFDHERLIDHSIDIHNQCIYTFSEATRMYQNNRQFIPPLKRVGILGDGR